MQVQSPSPKSGFQNSAVGTRCSITRQMNSTILKAHDSQDDRKFLKTFEDKFTNL